MTRLEKPTRVGDGTCGRWEIATPASAHLARNGWARGIGDGIGETVVIRPDIDRITTGQ